MVAGGIGQKPLNLASCESRLAADADLLQLPSTHESTNGLSADAEDLRHGLHVEKRFEFRHPLTLPSEPLRSTRPPRVSRATGGTAQLCERRFAGNVKNGGRRGGSAACHTARAAASAAAVCRCRVRSGGQFYARVDNQQ